LLLELACSKAPETGAGVALRDATGSTGSAGAPSAAARRLWSVRPRTSNILLITVDCMRADMPWAVRAPIAPNLTALEKIG
jgi:hypothetical protein